MNLPTTGPLLLRALLPLVTDTATVIVTDTANASATDASTTTATDSAPANATATAAAADTTTSTTATAAVTTTTATGIAAEADAASAARMKTRRSVLELAFSHGGAAMCHESKLQPVLSACSTEAKLIALASAAITAKHLRTAIMELGELFEDAAVICIGNVAALHMGSKSFPTNKKDTEIQHFAIQE